MEVSLLDEGCVFDDRPASETTVIVAHARIAEKAQRVGDEQREHVSKDRRIGRTLESWPVEVSGRRFVRISLDAPVSSHAVISMINFRFGSLTIFPALERQNLLASKVAEALVSLANASEIGIAEIDPTLSETAAFCAHYGVALDLAANCVVLEAARADHSWFAAWF